MKEKSPFDEVEEGIKKVKKNMKRNWKKIIIILALSVIIVSILLFIAGLKIKFVLQDGLVLSLDPTEQSFTISNNQNQTVIFHVSAEDNMFCQANCSYSLYDRSQEEVIDKGDLMLKNEGNLYRTYNLMSPAKGSGQKIYNFDIQCANIKTFLCPTYSPINRRSSFVIMNYALTEDEEYIKNDLKEALTKDIGLINNAGRNLQKSKYILNLTKNIIEYNELDSNYNDVSDIFNATLIDLKNMMGLWESEDYITLNDTYKDSFVKQSMPLYGKSDVLLSAIFSSIDKQNNIVNRYMNLRDKFLDELASQGRYIYYSPNKDMVNDIDKIHELFLAINSSDPIIESDLLNLTLELDSFNKSLNENYINLINKGWNLSAYEYSKKCQLGYCENSTDDVCLGLHRIILEYTNTTYNGSNVINLSQPYFARVEDKVKIIISNDSLIYYSDFCENLSENASFFSVDIPTMYPINISEFANISTLDTVSNELTENPPLCCVYKECLPCCKKEECKEDPSLYPTVLIHGHSLLKKTAPDPLLDLFDTIQYQLQEDGYINAGTIRFDTNTTEYKEDDWGLARFPITVKASYYYDYFYSLGNFIYISKRADNLDTYAIRLKEIIDLVKYRTGKPKLNIIAHSMGGLVARRYVQIFGEDSVNKMILIGTPNHGVESNILRFCLIFGDRRECEDMSQDSVFINRLNDPFYTPKEMKVYTISGKGCKMGAKDGDGVVTFESSLLDYAKSYVVQGKCTDYFNSELHTDLTNIDKYPQVYDDILEILKA